MGTDLSWLSQEAKNIHQTVESFFYLLITTLLLVGVVVEYFRLPLGRMPSFGVLVGRVLIAVILLQSYPTVTNTIAELSDGLSKQVGDLNKFDIIRDKLGQRFSQMTLSWLSVKESVTIVMCYVVFVLFHFSYYMAEAFLLYSWTLLYIFSPILIALFVVPATASATGALYRSLIEISLWKPVWAVSATLLWSLSLSEINKPQTDINFLSVVSLVLILAASLLLTPIVVHYLATAGLASLSPSLGKIGMAPLAFAPKEVARIMSKTGGHVSHGGKRLYNAAHTSFSGVSERYFPRANKLAQKLPRFNLPKSPPVFETKKGNRSK